MKTKTGRITIAMSGGVDSSVAAALLKRAGFNVKGMFFRLQKPSIQEKEARAAAKALAIPFSAVDLRKEFQRKVINPFLKGQKKGMTPNPCVVCNEEIKFKAPFRSGEFMATGHYARTLNGRLFKGKDKDKDQSYFLWRLSKKKLEKVIFPLGNYTKKEARAMAKELNLPFSGQKSSQEICFVPGTLCRFLSDHLPVKEGEIKDRGGKILGRHKGLWLYTIGQRKGIGLPKGPYYVFKKDLENNALIVTGDERDLYSKEAKVCDVNWISGSAPRFPFKAFVKVRYRKEPVQAILERLPKGCLRIVFKSGQKALTPGQSAVFYSKDEVIGGGILVDPWAESIKIE